jgi:hypothetical protein
MQTAYPGAGISQAKAATIAGSLYVITMATSMIAEMACISPLIVRGDVAATAANIIAHQTQFRIGIATMLFTTLAVVPLFWGLYVILKPVNRDLALLAVFWRLTETALISTALINHLVALKYLAGNDYLKVFADNQLYALMNVSMSTYGSALFTGFVPLGFGSAIFAWLFYKSAYVPRFIGALGIFASLLLGLSCFLLIIFPKISPIVYPYSMVPMFFYEVGLGLWLWIKGVKTGTDAEAV